MKSNSKPSAIAAAMCMDRDSRSCKALFDFHTHSTASDGALSPRELIQKARTEGISAIALTDHDTISGLNQANEAAKEEGIKFIRGIELNIQWQSKGGEFHLLGLGLKKISHSMEEIIAASRLSRQERNEKIMSLMAASGVNLDDFPDFISRLFPNNLLSAPPSDFYSRNVGRPHFADYLVEKGLCHSRQDAFDKYLGKGRHWYAERQGAHLDEAVKAVIDSGGIPIIAHPMSLRISWGHLAQFLDDATARGIEGIEAWHPSAREADCKRLERMAHERGLLVSAGSDYHGTPDCNNSNDEKNNAQPSSPAAARRLAHSSCGHCITAAFIDAKLLERLGISW